MNLNQPRLDWNRKLSLVATKGQGGGGVGPEGCVTTSPRVTFVVAGELCTLMGRWLHSPTDMIKVHKTTHAQTRTHETGGSKADGLCQRQCLGWDHIP